MGRAIVREPKAFLMDEPLSNLDAKLRVSMRASLAQLHSRLGVTTIYVTHDQTEAMTLGQRVAVMRSGRIVQVDEPQRLYDAPRDLFVAGFIGSPAMNLVEAAIDGDDVVFGAVPGPARRSAGRPAVRARRPRHPPGGVRGCRVRVAATCRSSPSQIEVVEELGSEAHVFFRVDAAPAARPRAATTTTTRPARRRPSACSPRGWTHEASARVGSTLALAVDPSRFHFFDPQTGESLVGGDAPSSSAAVEVAR